MRTDVAVHAGSAHVSPRRVADSYRQAVTAGAGPLRVLAGRHQPPQLQFPGGQRALERTLTRRGAAA